MNVLSTTTDSQNFTRAAEVQIPDIYNRRFLTGKEDLDNMFGGQGFMPNLTFTLAAAPGTGKTSMLLQILELLEHKGKKTAYISGEEGVTQLAFSSKRLGVEKVPLANLTDIDDICDAIVENKFDFVVLDSLPAISSRKKMNKKQLEEYVTTKIIQTAKQHEVVIGVILHFCKDGKSYKGSTLLPHSVDCNVMMTRNKEDYNLRDVDITKNRFGSAGQACFEMTSRGFTFEAVEQTEDTNNGKKTSKSEAILSILDTPKTLQQICQQTNASGAYLQTIVRQLVQEGKARKEGRGAEATYQKVDLSVSTPEDV
jgi:predicted ATP-dependent serine protease